MKYLIIGSGRAALSFTAFLSAKEIPFANWSRTSQLSQSDPSSQSPQAHKSVEFKSENLRDCTHVLLLISDSSIEAFFKKYLSGFQGKVIHCSGALEIPGTFSFHPLATFTRQALPVSVFEKIHFVTTFNGDISEVLPGFQNPTHRIFSVEKAKYHALCVMAGNFSVILWQKFFTEMNRMGIPQEAAGLYLDMIFNNIRENPQGALTGPLARKDDETIRKNMRALDTDPFLEIYSSFVNVQYPEYFKKSLTTPSHAMSSQSPQSKESDL